MQAFQIPSISSVCPICLILLDLLNLTPVQMLNKIKWAVKYLLSHRTATILKNSLKCLSCSQKSHCLTVTHSKAAHTTNNYECSAGEYKQRHESVDFKEFCCICVIGQRW
jgi:hypothetical protein